MFYSTTVLTKRGPLAKVWLAAHVHTKLTKAMALSTNVSAAVSRIIAPEAPMALRLTSQLLLGVVRIYSRKAKYLLADSSEALARLKLAYTPASSNDLQNAHANPAAITLVDADGDGVSATASASAASRYRDPVGALPMPDLEFPETTSQAGATPRYLADAKDITIDEYSGSSGIGTFGRDPDLDLLPVDEVERNRFALSYDDLEEEPLMFTPSQQRSTPSTPRRRSVLEDSDAGSAVESVEKMRDAAMPGDGLPDTPRLSFGPSTPGSGKAELSDERKEIEKDGTPQSFRSEGQDGRDSLALTPGETDGAAGVEGPQFLLPNEEDLAFPEEAATPAKENEAPRDEVVGDDGSKATGVPAEKDGSDDSGVDDHATDTGDEVRKRKRRANAALWDDETELPASYVRKCLNDTSDILRLRPHKRSRITLEARRRMEAERGLTARDILARPVIPLVAPELSELFASCIGAEALFKIPGSPVTSSGRGGRKSAAAARDLDSDGEQVEEEDGDKCGDKAAVAARSLNADVPASPMQRDDEEEAVEGSPSAGKKTANDDEAQQEEQGEEGRLSMSEPRFSMGGVSSVGDMPMLPMEDELPLPPAEEIPLPETHLRSPAAADVPRGAASGFTLAEVAYTQVVVKDADAEAAGELGDARMTTRALKMRDLLAERISPATGQVAFSQVLAEEPGVTRRVAARSFYELLNLCSRRVVSLEQETAYGDIAVVPVQPAFDSITSESVNDAASKDAVAA